MVAHNAAKFNCDTCQTRHCDDTRRSKYPIWKIEGVAHDPHICPKPIAHRAAARARYLYQIWCAWRDHHVLPAGGGWGDQWQRHVDAFDICAAFEQEQREERERERALRR